MLSRFYRHSQETHLKPAAEHVAPLQMWVQSRSVDLPPYLAVSSSERDPAQHLALRINGWGISLIESGGFR